ncbi:hypothetical protein EXIGLDRAFT_729624, partial [Exidia glandulosa HHB12029]
HAPGCIWTLHCSGTHVAFVPSTGCSAIIDQQLLSLYTSTSLENSDMECNVM